MTPNPTVPYILDFGAGDHLRLDLPLPQTEITAHEFLPTAFAIADAVVSHSSNTLAAMGKPIKCGPGCGACCSQLVPVSEYEAAHLANVVRTMPPAQRSRVINRFTRAIASLDEAGLISHLTDTFANEAHDWRKVLDLKKQYWGLNIPCPFLEDGSCSIHPHRPLACRQYLVTSDSAHCLGIYADNEAHEVVVHPVDTGGALASFSGEGLQKSKVLPHVFSLLAERGIRSQPASVLPARRMAARFLDLLSICFSRKG